MTPTKDPYWVSCLPSVLRDKLKGNEQLHRAIHNSGWLMFDKIVRTLLTLLVGAWVARYLGPGEFGALAYVLAFITFFQSVATLGADGVIVRYIAQDQDTAPRILGSMFAARLICGVLCWLLAIGGMAWSNGLHDRSVILVALAGGTLVFQAADTIDLWFQSQSQSRRTVVAKLIAYSAACGVRVALILSHAPLVAFAVALAFEALASAIGLMLVYRAFPTARRWWVARDTIVAIVKESWPYMLSGVSIMIYMRIDQIMLKEMLGDRQLGIYAAMLPLSQIWTVIPMTVVTSMAPFVARMKRSNEEAYLKSLNHIFRFLSGISIVASLGTAILAGLAIRILYGPEFEDSARALSIHVFGNVFISLGVAQSLWQINENRPRISIYKTVTGAVANVLGNYLMIPVLGIEGAAIASVASQFISSFAANAVFDPKVFKIQLCSLFQLNCNKRRPNL